MTRARRGLFLLLVVSFALVLGGVASPSAWAYAGGAVLPPAGDIAVFQEGQAGGAAGLAFGPDGNLWGVYESQIISVYSTTSGSVLARYYPGSGVGELISGPNSSLWFVQNNFGNSSITPQIGEISTTGTITDYPLPAGSGVLTSIAADAVGNVWFVTGSASANDQTGYVGYLAPDGSVTQYPLPAKFSSTAPDDLVAGPDGNMWFVGQMNGNVTVGSVTPAGAVTLHLVLFPTATVGPSGITVGSDGNLWFTFSSPQANNNTWPYFAASMSPAGGQPTIYALPAGFAQISGITEGVDGNVYVAGEFAGSSDSVVVAVAPTGQNTYFIGSNAVDPQSVAAGPDGNIWLGDNAAFGELTLTKPFSTTLALTSDANPAYYGQQGNVVARLTPVQAGAPAPTGTVTFTASGTGLDVTEPVVNGVALLPLADLAYDQPFVLSNDPVLARYNGDANYGPESSNVLSIVVNSSATTMTLTSSANPSTVGQDVQVTATVTGQGGGIPQDGCCAVQFTVDGGRYSVPLTGGGAATLDLPSLTAGSHAISASFGGWYAYGPSSASLTQTVQQQSTTTALTVSPTSGVLQGSPVTLTASETPQTAGTVQFYDGTTALGTPVTVTGGTATYTSSSLALGSHSFTAMFTPTDSGFSASTSPAASLTVSSGVTFAVTATSNVPRQLSKADLKALYHCDPGYVGTTPYALHPLLPQAGSALRAAWESMVGITDADVTNGVYPCISSTLSGQPVTDNNTVGLDNNSIVPVSIAAYLAQSQGNSPDVRGKALLGTISSVAPTIAGASQTVTFAVTATSNVPRQLSSVDLRALYHCDPNYVGTAPYTLHPLLPQAGSALRSAWESMVGITDADVTNGVYPCIRSTVGGQPVTDNNTVGLDNNSIVPVSIAAYLAQSQGNSPDVRGQALLGTIDSAPPAVPTSGSAATVYVP